MSKCQNDNYLEDFNYEKSQEKSLSKKSKEKKKIKYKGFVVNHRFISSEDELKEKHNKNYLKKLYNKLRKKNKKVASKGEDLELPNSHQIFEASKVVINKFPYEKLDGHTNRTSANESFANIEMIKSDFVGYTDADLELYNEVIDEYYSQNLDYLTLNEIAKNPEKYQNLSLNKSNSDEFWIAVCIMARALKNGYGLVRPIIAYNIATPAAESISEAKYISTMSYSDTRKDAFRHILWNSLLAQNYFTLSSKSKRIGFANLVSTKRETTCAPSNALDSQTMDFHNNFIGRNLWDLNTTYRTFLGANVGLRRPATSKLIDIAFVTVENRSCLIVKNQKDNPSFNYSIEETRDEILKVSTSFAVYIDGAIAPKREIVKYRLVRTPCEDEVVEINSTKRHSDINLGSCFRKEYYKEVLSACFVSKDPNYNPYN